MPEKKKKFEFNMKKIRQASGFIVGILMFIALIIVVIYTKRPTSDEPTFVKEATINIMSSVANDKLGEATLQLLNQPTAGQPLDFKLTIKNTKKWSLLNGSTRISFSSLAEVLRPEAPFRQINDGDKLKMAHADDNEFNTFAITNFYPTISIKKKDGTITPIEVTDILADEATGVTTTTTSASPTYRDRISAWLAKVPPNCQKLTLPETMSKEILTDSLDTVNEGYSYCADTSSKVLKNLDIYQHGLIEEFLFTNPATGVVEYHETLRSLVNGKATEIISPIPSATTYNFPHSKLTKDEILDIEQAKLYSPPNSSSLYILPQGEASVRFSTNPLPDKDDSYGNSPAANLDVNLNLKISSAKKTYNDTAYISLGSPLRYITTYSRAYPAECSRKQGSVVISLGSYGNYLGQVESAYKDYYECKLPQDVFIDRHTCTGLRGTGTPSVGKYFCTTYYTDNVLPPVYDPTCQINYDDPDVIKCARDSFRIRSSSRNVYTVIPLEIQGSVLADFNKNDSLDLKFVQPITVLQHPRRAEIHSPIATATPPNTLTVGSTATLTAKVIDQFGNEIFENNPGDLVCNWTNNNPEYASISPATGLATVVKALKSGGNATILTACTYKGQTPTNADGTPASPPSVMLTITPAPATPTTTITRTRFLFRRQTQTKLR
ncbi:MAG: hypothetical protein CEN91_285 [Candidatus Berkelbacteria bacterium Licking1014_85]|uniref:Uncharacterized protein n=1 Tax=Candidatus Berkelbacteria bacterium Licking1014_85 TaxID=2017148 RepID=A0A554LJZ4_9BACT|nr:MAG: hypothetical protein CEN91_285 [Candidatus Berkelbacteria bacterium Licking1014_85]